MINNFAQPYDKHRVLRDICTDRLKNITFGNGHIYHKAGGEETPCATKVTDRKWRLANLKSKMQGEGEGLFKASELGPSLSSSSQPTASA